MITLEKTKKFFAELRKSSPYNLMIPIIVGILAIFIILRNKIRIY